MEKNQLHKDFFGALADKMHNAKPSMPANMLQRILDVHQKKAKRRLFWVNMAIVCYAMAYLIHQLPVDFFHSNSKISSNQIPNISTPVEAQHVTGRAENNALKNEWLNEPIKINKPINYTGRLLKNSGAKTKNPESNSIVITNKTNKLLDLKIKDLQYIAFADNKKVTKTNRSFLYSALSIPLELKVGETKTTLLKNGGSGEFNWDLHAGISIVNQKNRLIMIGNQRTLNRSLQKFIDKGLTVQPSVAFELGLGYTLQNWELAAGFNYNKSNYLINIDENLIEVPILDANGLIYGYQALPPWLTQHITHSTKFTMRSFSMPITISKKFVINQHFSANIGAGLNPEINLPDNIYMPNVIDLRFNPAPNQVGKIINLGYTGNAKFSYQINRVEISATANWMPGYLKKKSDANNILQLQKNRLNCGIRVGFLF